MGGKRSATEFWPWSLMIFSLFISSINHENHEQQSHVLVCVSRHSCKAAEAYYCLAFPCQLYFLIHKLFLLGICFDCSASSDWNLSGTAWGAEECLSVEFRNGWEEQETVGFPFCHQQSTFLASLLLHSFKQLRQDSDTTWSPVLSKETRSLILLSKR